jgi:hypothetical protein
VPGYALPLPILQRSIVLWIREVGHRWFLRAGFSMYRFDAVKDLLLDFGQDWFNGLDTGGANWNVPYRTHDRKKLEFASTHFAPYKPGADQAKALVQWCGIWLHEVGSTDARGLQPWRLTNAGWSRNCLRRVLQRSGRLQTIKAEAEPMTFDLQP